LDTENKEEVNNVITRIDSCVAQALTVTPLELVLTAVCAHFLFLARRTLRSGCPGWVADLFASVCHGVLGEVEARKLRE
jgi:hypothetical protein